MNMETPIQSDMKVPSRPAPPLPNSQNTRKTRSHTLDLLSLGNDPFNSQVENLNSDGNKHGIRKKPPPPRPPPPKYKSNSTNKGSTNLLDIFGRSKDSSRSKAAATAIVKPLPPVHGSDIPIDSLIDLHSPSISPTFTKSSSSGLSVDSFGSLTTQSHSNSSSQLESGFEDDFISSSGTTPSNDPFSEGLDPFSPTSKISPQSFFELSNDDPKAKYRVQKKATSNSVVNKPTIIRVKAKPSRPPPPMNKVNCNKSVRSPMEGVTQGGDAGTMSSPPMPTVPPPPPPPEVVQALLSGPPLPPRPSPTTREPKEAKKPYCIAEYNYEATHPDDLSFAEGEVISLISQVNDDWFKGRLSGIEGIFPANYVKVIVPLGQGEPTELTMTVIALYPFMAETWDDLNFQEGEEIKVLKRINENWLYGECNGRRGQFPENFVQDITPLINSDSL